MSPSLATGKTGAAAPKNPSSLNTETVRPAPASPAKRFIPGYVGEPIVGHVTALKNPDGTWVAPGGKFQPGAHLALRPYYGPGPGGDESTQWNAAQVAAAQKIQIENYGTPGYVLRSMIPGGLDEGGAKNLAEAVARGADVASWFVPPGAAVKGAGLFGIGIKGLKGIRGAEAVAEEVPAAAHATEEAGAVRAALPGAKVQRGKQEAGYSVERGKRVAAGQVHLDNPNLSPAERVAKAKGELPGELPKIRFKGFDELNDQQVEALQVAILDHPHLTFFQKINASDAFIGALAGKTPTRSEIRLLEHVFGKDTVVDLSALARSPWRERVLNTLNIPRSLMASFDFSAPFRQGLIVATRHPAIFSRNLGPMFKAFGSEKVYQAMLDEIKSRPSYPLMVEAKLPLTDLGEIGGYVGGREERFASSYAEWPLGKYNPVRASGRAYTGFLDKTRADVFDHLIGQAQAQGVNVQDKHFLQSLGKFVGSATGRGSLGVFEDSAKVLNATLFSPRLLASRLNFLNPAYYKNLHPFARKEALRSAFQLLGSVSTVLALASRIPGVKVGVDPTNPNWGKIRIGNTRIDIAGGFQQDLRLLAQIASGISTSSTTDKSVSLTSGKFGQPTRLSKTADFFVGKLSPTASLVADKLRGSTQIGQKFTWGSAATQRLIPLLAQDSYDLYKENHGGMNGLLAALTGYGVGSVGFGVQTYGPSAPKGGGGGTDTGSIYDTPGSSSSSGSIYDSP